MGVDTSAITMVGIMFDDHDKAVDYVNEHMILGEVISRTYEIDEMGNTGITYEDYTEYDDCGGALGFFVYDSDPEKMALQIVESFAKLKTIIPEEDWYKIKFHNWVQYN